MERQKKQPLLPSFLHSELSPDKPLNLQEKQELERILGTAEQYTYPELNTGEQWNQFLLKSGNNLKISKKPVRFAMFRWAAAAIIVLGTGFGLFRIYDYRANTYTAEFVRTSPQRQQLPDGSMVYLNKGTNLKVLAINNDKRILELSGGEIFVSVKHNKVPFLVRTSHGVISVLGTEFTIRDIQDERFTVFLKKGKIRFESSGVSSDLQAGEILTEDQSGDFTISKANSTYATAWMDGKLQFSNALVSEVVQALEKTHQVRFVYDHALDSERITATFDGLDASQSANMLSKTLRSDFSVK